MALDEARPRGSRAASVAASAYGSRATFCGMCMSLISPQQ